MNFKLTDYAREAIEDAQKKVPLDVYEHYKGSQYEVVGYGIHTDSLEVLISYTRVGGSGVVWMRPLRDWLSSPANHPHVKRFRRLYHRKDHHATDQLPQRGDLQGSSQP